MDTLVAIWADYILQNGTELWAQLGQYPINVHEPFAQYSITLTRLWRSFDCWMDSNFGPLITGWIHLFILAYCSSGVVLVHFPPRAAFNPVARLWWALFHRCCQTQQQTLGYPRCTQVPENFGRWMCFFPSVVVVSVIHLTVRFDVISARASCSDASCCNTADDSSGCCDDGYDSMVAGVVRLGWQNEKMGVGLEQERVKWK